MRLRRAITRIGQGGPGEPVRCYTDLAAVGVTEAGTPNRRQGEPETVRRSQTAGVWTTVRASIRFGPPNTACSKWHTRLPLRLPGTRWGHRADQR